MHWKSNNTEKNLGCKPTYWGGNGISISRLRRQDASTGCKCWHVMQPWTIAALRWCKKEKSTLRKNPHYHMNECQQECMADSEGGGEHEALYTQQSVVCMEEREKKIAGVCFALIKRGKRNSANKRKADGKVDQVFCLRGAKDPSHSEDLDVNIIGFYCQAHVAQVHTSTSRKSAFFFTFLSAPQTNPHCSSPSTSPSLSLSSSSLHFLTQTCTLVLRALAICYLRVRGASFPCPEHIVVMRGAGLCSLRSGNVALHCV